MKFRKVIESGIITAALALTSVTTAVSASAAETGTTTESATVNANVADRVSQAASTGVQSVQIIQQNAWKHKYFQPNFPPVCLFSYYPIVRT